MPDVGQQRTVGFLSLYVRSVTCQARFPEPLGLGDLAAGRLCNQERLRLFFFPWIDRFKLAIHECSQRFVTYENVPNCSFAHVRSSCS